MITSYEDIIRLFERGGPVFVLLGLTSVVCLTLIIERFIALRRSRILPARLVNEVDSLVSNKKVSEALTLCRSNESSVARVLVAGLSDLSLSKDELDENVEMVGKRESSVLERNLDFLGTLAAVGPLLGLFGTVTGMIRTFSVVGVVGVGDPIKLAGGIGEALLNTAAGMAVGIPALVFQHYFYHRVDRYILDMEEFAQRMLKVARRGG